LIKLHNPI